MSDRGGTRLPDSSRARMTTSRSFLAPEGPRSGACPADAEPTLQVDHSVGAGQPWHLAPRRSASTVFPGSENPIVVYHRAGVRSPCRERGQAVRPRQMASTRFVRPAKPDFAAPKRKRSDGDDGAFRPSASWPAPARATEIQPRSPSNPPRGLASCARKFLRRSCRSSHKPHPYKAP